MIIVDRLGLDEQCDVLAPAIAAALEPGDVVELLGEMGAGKTTLTASIGRALGVTEPVRSPTFTIAHSYDAGGGRTLAHLDCWRAGAGGTVDPEQWGDLDAYLDATWLFVEWPEPARAWLAGRPTWRVHLVAPSLAERRIEITAPDAAREGALHANLSAALADRVSCGPADQRG